MSGARSYRSRETVLQEIRRGGLCAILVEGEEQGSDAALLKYILRGVTTEVTFFGRDGRPNVLADLQEMIPLMPADRLFAIVDRDFESDQIVDKCFQPAYRGHALFWRRFTLENYLLEPAWIVETVQHMLWQNPALTPPPEFQTESAVEALLLESTRQFLSATAGNATIAGLTSEQRKRHLPVEGRNYFNAGDDETVIAKLIAHYSVFANTAPDLYSSSALQQRYNERHTAIRSAVQSLSNAHRFVSGKMLLTAIHRKLLTAFPGYKIRRVDILEKLMEFASKQVPDDLHTLVEDRILPRWRRARTASA